MGIFIFFLSLGEKSCTMQYNISLVFPYMPLISLRKFPFILLDFVVVGFYSTAMVYYIDFQMLVYLVMVCNSFYVLWILFASILLRSYFFLKFFGISLSRFKGSNSQLGYQVADTRCDSHAQKPEVLGRPLFPPYAIRDGIPLVL